MVCLNRHIFCVFLNIEVALINVAMWHNDEWSTKSYVLTISYYIDGLLEQIHFFV